MLYIILLFILVLVLAVLYYTAWSRANYLRDRLGECLEKENEAVLAYRALDQGMVELSDAYETDSLQYEDTIEKLNIEKARVAENNSTLLHNARIDRIARHEQERTIHSLREEVVGVKRQLDIAQTIISEHDLNCLPHIVLKSMEPQEQDTPLPI